MGKCASSKLIAYRNILGPIHGFSDILFFTTFWRSWHVWSCDTTMVQAILPPFWLATLTRSQVESAKHSARKLKNCYYGFGKSICKLNWVIFDLGCAATDQEKQSVQRQIKKRRVCSDRLRKEKRSRKVECAATDQEKQSMQRQIKKRRVCSAISRKEECAATDQTKRVIKKSRVCSDSLRKEEWSKKAECAATD